MNADTVNVEIILKDYGWNEDSKVIVNGKEVDGVSAINLEWDANDMARRQPKVTLVIYATDISVVIEDGKVDYNEYKK